MRYVIIRSYDGKIGILPRGFRTLATEIDGEVYLMDDVAHASWMDNPNASSLPEVYKILNKDSPNNNVRAGIIRGDEGLVREVAKRYEEIGEEIVQEGNE